MDLPSAAGIEALRRFLTFGGFLLIDSAEGATDGAFDGSVRKLITAIFPSPAKGLEIVPPDHVVYKSFYLLDKPVGRLAIAPALEGVVSRRSHWSARTSPNDLGGAWARDDFGNYDFPCEPGGEKQRELAFRFGVNLVMYALCLDYKSDQVHVPFIMKRRRWKPDDGASTSTVSEANARTMSIALFSNELRIALAIAGVVLGLFAVIAVRRGRSALGAMFGVGALAALGALAGEALVALTVRLAAPRRRRLQRVPLGVPVAMGPARALCAAALAVVAIVALVVAGKPRRARRGGARS